MLVLINDGVCVIQLNQYKLGKVPGDGAESDRVNGKVEALECGKVAAGADPSLSVSLSVFASVRSF